MNRWHTFLDLFLGGPCRQIEQQMKILARELADGDAGEVLKIGVVDCNDHYNFCSDRHGLVTKSVTG